MNPEAVRMIAKQAVAAQEKDPAATEIDRIKEDKKLIQKKIFVCMNFSSIEYSTYEC